MKKRDAATDRSSCTSFMEEAVGVGSQESAASTMDDGRWTMDDGRWTMDDGRWTMDDGRWTMDDGRWTIDDGRWTMDNGQWTMDDGRWTMDDGRWMMDDVERLHKSNRLAYEHVAAPHHIMFQCKSMAVVSTAVLIFSYTPHPIYV
jgi:hypothetical protein